jgi:branched-chain amino acid transport system ATP-binding protein
VAQPLLEAKGVTMQFGGLKAVDNFNLQLMKGELVGLIGPNGAGKTTVFNTLTGVYKPTMGDVTVEGRSTLPLKPYQISHLGVTRTFQNIRLFKEMTVLQNVLIAAHQHTRYGMLAAVMKSPAYFLEEDELRKKGLELLSIFQLDTKADFEAGGLPYGQQRKLEIIRAMATNPKVIMLDEPAAGMNHKETEGLMETIAQIRKDFGLTVLLIEHDMKLVMGICERILVLDHGTTIASGTPDQIKRDPKVIAAYLGQDATA